MNYNLKVEIERVNGVFVTQVEMSNYGRARRTVSRFDKLLDALKAVDQFQKEGLKEMESFNAAAPANLPAPEVPPAQAAEEADPDNLTDAQIAEQNAKAIAAVEAAKAAKGQGSAPPADAPAAAAEAKPAKTRAPRGSKAKARQFAAA